MAFRDEPQLVPELTRKAQEPSGWQEFVDAYALSPAGQAFDRLVHMPSQSHGQGSRTYNPLTDDSLRDTFAEIPAEVVYEAANAASRDEFLDIVARYNRNMGRRERLAINGYSFSQFAAGILDPLNLVPVPFALGRGVVGGVRRAMAPTVSIIGSAEVGRHLLDPTSTPQETMVAIAASSLFAGAIGGAVGGWSTRKIKPLGEQMPAHIMNRRVNNAANQEDFARGSNDLDSYRKVAEYELSETRFAREFAPYLPEGVTYRQMMRDQVADPGGKRYLRYQYMREPGQAFGQRVRIDPRKGTLETQTGKGPWVMQRKGRPDELIGSVDTISARYVDNFYERESMEIGLLEVNRIYPDRPPAGEARARYDENYQPETAIDGIRRESLPTQDELKMREVAAEEMTLFEANDRVVRNTESIRQLEGQIRELRRQTRGHPNQYTKKKLKKIEALADQIDSLKSGRNMLNSEVTRYATRLDRMRESNIINGTDIAGADGGIVRSTTKGLGASGQFPFYTLLENRLRTLANWDPSLGRDWQIIANRLAGSPGIYSAENKAFNGRGPSVEFKSQTHMAEYANTRATVQGIYHKYAGFTSKEESVTAGKEWITRARTLGQKVTGLLERKENIDHNILTPDAFEKEVHFAVFNGERIRPGIRMDKPTKDAIESSAKEWRAFLNKYKDDGVKLGLFKTAENTNRRIANIEAQLEKRMPLEQRNKLLLELDSAELELDYYRMWGTDSLPGSPQYNHTIWDPDLIEDQIEDLRRDLTEHFLQYPYIYRRGQRIDLSTKPEDVRARVDSTIANMRREWNTLDPDNMVETGSFQSDYERRLAEIDDELAILKTKSTEPARKRTERLGQIRKAIKETLEKKDFPRAGTPRPTLGYRITSLPHEKFAKYMVQDQTSVMLSYTVQMSRRMEMAREFGDLSMRTTLQGLADRTQAAARRARAQGNPGLAKNIIAEGERLEKAAIDLRDRVLGTYGMSDPHTLSARVANFFLTYGNMLYMGKAVQAQMLDLANAVAFMGFKRFFGTTFNSVARRFNDAKGEWDLALDEVQKMGIANEILTAHRFHSLTNTGAMFQGQTKLERKWYNMGGNFYMHNMMGPATDFMSERMAVVVIDRILDISRRMARGEKLAEKEVRDVARAGLSPELARRIYAQWRRVPKEDRQFRTLNLAATHLWDDDELVKSLSAITRDVVKAFIITPGAADKPAILLSNDWAKVIAQFKVFPIAASQRITLANMQRGDAMALQSIMMLIAGGWMLDTFRRPDYIELDYDDQLFRSIELSGIAGVLPDINSMLEAATANNAGLRPMFGLTPVEREPNWATQIAPAVGPAPSVFSGLAWAFSSDEATWDDRARAIRQMVIYNNFGAFSDMVTRVQRETAGALEATFGEAQE